MKLVLVNAIAYPVEAHVYGFGALLFDVVVCNPCCRGVIHLNRSGGLRMSQFFQCCSEDDGFFHVGKKSGSFGFGGRGNNNFYDAGRVEDGSVV